MQKVDARLWIRSPGRPDNNTVISYEHCPFPLHR